MTTPASPADPYPGTTPGVSRAPGTPGLGPSGGTTGTAAPTGPTGGPVHERHTGKTIGRTLALALLLFVTVVLVLFVVFNTQSVDISLVFADVNAPLILALLIAAVLGALVSGLAAAVLRTRRRNR
ncbi:lipopolysaccharide assembly LapA domain-containing protein [Blastococcus sp. URHD0036]|uniref:LapA family protein n=1 Tax=Blastococcus sp. URHD0036 TaxID=1380356 RepID=UPI0004951B34|nr:LapA family protein [Blastococcus sp. URHD0036]